MSRAAAAFSVGEIHVGGRQAERLPLQPAFEQHRPPGIAAARKGAGQLGLEPVELLGGQPAAVAGS